MRDGPWEPFLWRVGRAGVLSSPPITMKTILRLVSAAGFALLVLAPLPGADFAKKRNYQACLRGLPECNREMLSWTQRPSVKRADVKRERQARELSFRACQGRIESVPCDLSILTPKQYAKVGGESYRTYRQTGSDAAPAARSSTKAPIDNSPAVRHCAENGSCYGDTSTATGRPKTVHVKGYYRSDGTYVRGHYRSKPR